MRRNDDHLCERSRCRRECTLTYLLTRLCQHHWSELCSQQDRGERTTIREDKGRPKTLEHQRNRHGPHDQRTSA